MFASLSKNVALFEAKRINSLLEFHFTKISMAFCNLTRASVCLIIRRFENNMDILYEKCFLEENFLGYCIPRSVTQIYLHYRH